MYGLFILMFFQDFGLEYDEYLRALKKEHQMVYCIDFHRNFLDTKVSMKINGTTIFEDVTLNSDPVLDLAGYLTIKDDQVSFSTYKTYPGKGQTWKSKIKVSFPFQLDFVIDGKKETYLFEPLDGIYLGITNAGGVFYYDQRKTPFYLD